MELFKTSRGNDMLIYNGFMYTSKKKSITSIRWECRKAKEGSKGGVTTDVPMGNPRNPAVHNHLASDADIELTKCRQRMKESARQNSTGKTSEILSSGIHGLSAAAMLATPQSSSMKRDIQRQKARERPNEPQTIQTIHLAHPWTTTGGANPIPFKFYDSGAAAGPDRIIVFGADDNLQHLAATDTWYMDGNFKSTPNLFLQTYVIRCKLDDGAISCVYALLPSKDRPTYTELFVAVQRRIQQLGLANNVRSINLDFEQGAYNAFINVFGQHVRISGCFFHLSQSTLRKAGELGLKQYIIEGSAQFNDVYRRFAGMIDGLAFVPIGHLNIAVQVLRNNVPNPVMQPLLDYFVNTYVIGQAGPPPQPPMFRPQM